MSSDYHVMFTLFSVHLSKAVVAHLIHEAVEEYRGALAVHTKFSLGSEIIGLLDVASFLRTSSNSHHPQELVDIWEREGEGEGGRGRGRGREREREGEGEGIYQVAKVAKDDA